MPHGKFSLRFACVSGIIYLFLTSLVDVSQQSMGARPPVLPRASFFGADGFIGPAWLRFQGRNRGLHFESIKRAEN